MKRETAENYELWPERVAAALDYFASHANGYQRWRRDIELYNNNHWREWNTVRGLMERSDDTPTPVVVPVTSSTVNSFLPYLTQKDPKFIFKPQEPQDTTAAQLITGLVNKEWQVRRNKFQFKKIVKNQLVIGFGIGRTHYVVKTDAPAADKKKGNVDYNLHIVEDSTQFTCIDNFRFIWEPESPDRDLNSARWCVEIITRPRQDVVDDIRYSPSARRGVLEFGKPTSDYVQRYGAPDSATGVSNYEDFVTLYVVWDKKFMQRLVFCDGFNDEPLNPPDKRGWPYTDEFGDVYLDTFPYQMLPYITLLDEPFPIGIPALIKDQQLQVNRSMDYLFRHANAQKRGFWVNDEGVIDPESVERKIKQAKDMYVVHTTMPGDAAIGVVQDAPAASDIPELLGICMQTIRDATGSSEIQRGGNMPSGTTATEVQARTAAMGFKIDDVQDNIDLFLFEVGGAMSKHIQANFTKERAIKVMGKMGEFWLTEPDPTGMQLIPKIVTAEDLKGQFDLEIESTVAGKMDPEKDQVNRISLLKEFVAMGFPIDPIEGSRWALEPFDYKDVSRLMPALAMPPAPIGQPTPPPMTTMGIQAMQAQQQAPGTGAPGIMQNAVNPNSEQQGPMGGQGAAG